MKQFWIGVALSCVGGAALALWHAHYDAAFVIGIIGALAWFLNFRARIKETLIEPEDDSEKPTTDQED